MNRPDPERPWPWLPGAYTLMEETDPKLKRDNFSVIKDVKEMNKVKTGLGQRTLSLNPVVRK